MDTTAYANLLMLYNGIEHVIDLNQVRLSRRATLPQPLVTRFRSVGLQFLNCEGWSSSPLQLRNVWEKAINAMPFLAAKTVIFDEVSAQLDLLHLLYCLAGLTTTLVENDPAFIEEKKNRLVTIKPLKVLANEAELTAGTPTDILNEINTRLDKITEFVQTKMGHSSR